MEQMVRMLYRYNINTDVLMCIYVPVADPGGVHGVLLHPPLASNPVSLGSRLTPLGLDTEWKY